MKKQFFNVKKQFFNVKKQFFNVKKQETFFICFLDILRKNKIGNKWIII